MNMFRVVDYGDIRMVAVDDMVEACGLLADAYRREAEANPDKLERFLAAEYAVRAFQSQLHQLNDDTELIVVPDDPAPLFDDDTPPVDPPPPVRKPTPTRHPRPTLWRRLWRSLFG